MTTMAMGHCAFFGSLCQRVNADDMSGTSLGLGCSHLGNRDLSPRSEQSDRRGRGSGQESGLPPAGTGRGGQDGRK